MGIGSKLKKIGRKVESSVRNASKKAYDKVGGAAVGAVLGSVLAPMTGGLSIYAGAYFGSQLGMKGFEGQVRAVRDQMTGKEPPMDTPSWGETDATISNEGVSEGGVLDLKRKRLAAAYSLGSTRGATGRATGGAISSGFGRKIGGQ